MAWNIINNIQHFLLLYIIVSMQTDCFYIPPQPLNHNPKSGSQLANWASSSQTCILATPLIVNSIFHFLQLTFFDIHIDGFISLIAS